MKTVEFKGVLSGDHESFCWDVDRNTFIQLTGRKPKKYDNTCFNDDGLYRVYPNDLFKEIKNKDNPKYQIKHRFKISFE